MKCLVTGSAGVLGGCLVSRLRERGDEILHVDLVEPRGGVPPGEAFSRADVSAPGAVAKAAKDPDVIYHLAAAQRMKPQFASWSEEEVYERNLGGVREVLDVARGGGTGKVVFISSSAIYGIPRGGLCAEDHPHEPLGAYGRSKLEAEQLCLEAAADGVDVVMLRPMSLFGPHMTGVFVMLFEWVRSGTPIYVLGNGRNRVQMVSAWDVADAAVLAADREGLSGRAFNIGSDPASIPSVIDQVSALAAHGSSTAPVVPIPASLLRTAARSLNLFGLSPIVPEHYILADRDFVLDIRAARQELGFEPLFDNLRMTCEAYDWYVESGSSVWQPGHPLVRLLNHLWPWRWIAARAADQD